jgi:hypothetical protein
MLDTSVIYPFLFGVLAVAAGGVAVAVGLLLRESGTNRGRRDAAPATEWVPPVPGQAVAWNLGAGDRTPRG